MVDREELFNGHIIKNADLKWKINLYKITPFVSNSVQTQFRPVDLMWKAWRSNRDCCHGSGFIIGIDKDKVITNQGWDIPDLDDFNGYSVKKQDCFDTNPNESKHQNIISGILKDACKKAFKSSESSELGSLWQNYNWFCQTPKDDESERYHFCRTFDVIPIHVRSGHWVLRYSISTITVDTNPISYYYREAKLNELVEMVKAKLENRYKRDNSPASLKALLKLEPPQSGYKSCDLANPDEFEKHNTLSTDEIIGLANEPIQCSIFPHGNQGYSKEQVFLISDTKLTESAHSKAIINPSERLRLWSALKNIFDGMDANGEIINLSSEPLSTRQIETFDILPPSIQFKESTLPAPNKLNISEMKKRAQEKKRRVKREGFKHSLPMKPLLAIPENLDWNSNRIGRLCNDFSHILNDSSGLEYKFKAIQYENAYSVREAVAKGDYTTVMAVLPEHSSLSQNENDTHEQIKKNLTVPSQCIHHNNTLPLKWVKRKRSDLKNQEPRLKNKIDNQYGICIDNLLVKNGWLPFVHPDPYNYNVHIGIDVGGVSNNTVVISVGYGFRQTDRWIFETKPISVPSSKVEPIPVQFLKSGLIDTLTSIKTNIESIGDKFDIDTILFYRDGVFLGDGERWNERTAFSELFNDMKSKGWVSDQAMWTGVEFKKRSSNWRVISRNGGSIENPIVGRCFGLSNDSDEYLICTTGAPYINQGTAKPSTIKIIDFEGTCEHQHVLQDLIWQTDLSFTKYDQPTSLPLILSIADKGAIQKAKMHIITGVTV